MPAFVSCLRVSTDRQGRDGYGIEAQRAAVAGHAATCGDAIVAEFVEVESGRRRDRPELARVLAACRARKAILLIARLDRLARNVAFVSNLMEGGVGFVAADVPTVTKFTIHILAAVAEEEARVISARTRAALAVAKARARPADLMPVIAEARAAGIGTLGGIAGALAVRGIPTLSGRGAWHAATARRLLACASA